jgi:Xylose isomerase-like TIM barrel.
MKLSFSTLATPNLTALQAILLARKYGFHGVDLRVSEDRGDLTISSSRDQIMEIKNALHSEGIRISSLMAYSQPGTIRDGILRHIALAECIGAEIVRLPLPAKPKEILAESWIAYLIAELSSCLDEAVAARVTLLIQNHYNQLNALQCARLIKQINHSQLQMLLSTDHCLIQNESISTVLQEARGITGQLYIADIRRNKISYDDVLPGTGEVPLVDFYNGLGGNRYDGWITLKWEKLWRPELADYEIALPFFMSYIRNHFKRSHEEGEGNHEYTIDA